MKSYILVNYNSVSTCPKMSFTVPENLIQITSRTTTGGKKNTPERYIHAYCWYCFFLVFLKTGIYQDWECSSVSSQKEDVNNYFCTQTLRYILRQWPCVPAVALWILLTAGLGCVMEVWFVFTCPELQSSQEQPEEVKQCRDSITVFYQQFTLALQ